MPEELDGWFEQTRVNTPCREISFGQYRVGLDEGTLVMQNTSRKQIDIINSLKLGMGGGITEHGRLVLSAVIARSPESGNAGFFLLDSGQKKAAYVSLTYSDDEVEMRASDYELGFKVSDDFYASANGGNLIVIDRKLGRYELTLADGRTLSAKMKLGKDAKCFMLPRETALITDSNEAYLINSGTRHLIDIAELAKKNGSPLSNPVLGIGEREGVSWLAIKDAKWKKECLLVALGGNEKFGYDFASLSRPDGKIEGIRK